MTHFGAAMQQTPCSHPSFSHVQYIQKVQLFQLQVKEDVCLKNPHINMLTHVCQPNAAEAVANAVKQQGHQSLQPICSTITNPVDRVNEERIKKLEQRVSQLIKKVHN